ncbi:maleylacetate reductase [Paramyrothecium foliicola]|nr:maleylacetate reductase [Paramyrothecium foliicola]
MEVEMMDTCEGLRPSLSFPNSKDGLRSFEHLLHSGDYALTLELESKPIESWQTSFLSKKNIGFRLEHKYPEDNLSMRRLKGDDKILFEKIFTAYSKDAYLLLANIHSCSEISTPMDWHRRNVDLERVYGSSGNVVLNHFAITEDAIWELQDVEDTMQNEEDIYSGHQRSLKSHDTASDDSIVQRGNFADTLQLALLISKEHFVDSIHKSSMTIGIEDNIVFMALLDLENQPNDKTIAASGAILSKMLKIGTGSTGVNEIIQYAMVQGDRRFRLALSQAISNSDFRSKFNESIKAYILHSASTTDSYLLSFLLDPIAELSALESLQSNLQVFERYLCSHPDWAALKNKAQTHFDAKFQDQPMFDISHLEFLVSLIEARREHAYWLQTVLMPTLISRARPELLYQLDQNFVRSFELSEQRGGLPDSGGAGRMAKRNGAAVGIYPVDMQPQDIKKMDDLACEGLVGLKSPHVCKGHVVVERHPFRLGKSKLDEHIAYQRVFHLFGSDVGSAHRLSNDIGLHIDIACSLAVLLQLVDTRIPSSYPRYQLPVIYAYRRREHIVVLRHGTMASWFTNNLNFCPAFDIKETPKVSYGRPFTDACAALITHHLFCRRVYIIASASLTRNTEALTRLKQALGERVAGVHIGISTHTPIQELLPIITEARRLDIDCLVTLGAGSITDGAKIIRYSLANNACDLADVNALRGARPHDRNEPNIPLICVPTTLSGGEYQAIAGATDEETRQKVLFDPIRDPDIVIQDPQLCTTTPERIWLSTGVRAIDHCVETLCSLQSNDEADAWASRGLTKLVGGLLGCKADLMYLEARHQCQVGVVEAMRAVSCGVPLGASHAIGHQLGPLGVPHGETSCVMLPAVCSFNRKEDINVKKQTAVVALLLGLPPISELLSSKGILHDNVDLAKILDLFLRELGMPRTLKEVGVAGPEKLRLLVVNSLKDHWIKTNAIPIVEESQVMEILQMVME